MERELAENMWGLKLPAALQNALLKKRASCTNIVKRVKVGRKYLGFKKICCIVKTSHTIVEASCGNT